MRNLKIVGSQSLQQIRLRLHPVDIDAHQHFRKLFVIQSPRAIDIIFHEQSFDFVRFEIAPEFI